MTRGRITVRTAETSQARKLHALISANLEEGHLLPRTLNELAVHAERFAIAVRGKKIVGCAELAPLSPHVAEVRSLAVDGLDRGRGVGTELVDELRRRARREGFEKLCAFTHAPGYFIQMGFSIVPHLWLPDKIFTDCVKCPHFRQCGQQAMVVSLDEVRDGPLDEIRGRPLDGTRDRALELMVDDRRPASVARHP
jgi:amino-acid N-acetyltransferase